MNIRHLNNKKEKFRKNKLEVASTYQDTNYQLHVDIVKVGGSSPLPPTKYFKPFTNLLTSKNLPSSPYMLVILRKSGADNVAKQLKSLKGKTPWQFITEEWTKHPETFIIDPNHFLSELNNRTRPKNLHLILNNPNSSLSYC